MKHEREAATMTASPWAATILPGAAGPPKRNRKAAHVEPPAPVATFGGSAPVAVDGPVTASAVAGAPVASPGQPPARDLPTDLHRHSRAARGTNRRLRIVTLAVALPLALGATAYLELPKLHAANTATGPATIAFPLAIDNFTRSAPAAARGLPTLSALKGDTPALAAGHLATYGAKPNIVVLAGLLPSSLRASTPARQLAIAATIDATTRELLGPGRLTLVTQPNRNATLQCEFTPAVLGATSWTGCVWIDGEAIVVTSVSNPVRAAGLALTKRVIADVERR